MQAYDDNIALAEKAEKERQNDENEQLKRH